MITVRDIAAQLNLHYTTVAKALQDHPDISKTTKEKVKAVAKELNYQPNLLARSFKQKKSNTVGIIVPSINFDFAAALISGVEKVINDAGYTLTICQTNESLELEKLHLQKYMATHVEGIIIQVTGGEDSAEQLIELKQRGIKVVLVDRILQKLQNIAVVVDDYNGSFAIVEHLINSGYSNIAHLGGPEHLSVSVDRKTGYIDALKKHNITIDPDLIIQYGFYEKDGQHSMNKLLEMDKKFDAVFCANDAIAAGVYLAMNSKGLKIPNDVAVAGFGNMAISKYLNPQLTTVNQFPEELGKKAAESLIDLIKKDKIDDSNLINVIQTELIVRKST